MKTENFFTAGRDSFKTAFTKLETDHHQKDMTRQPEEKNDTARRPAGDMNCEQEFALVVDDDALALEVTRDILVAMGYEVDTAQDGLEAMECLHQRHYDIVVSDLMMPGMDGIALARRIKQMPDHIHVIIMTGQSETNVDTLTNSDVVDGWVFKPFDMSDLRCMLQQEREPRLP